MSKITKEEAYNIFTGIMDKRDVFFKLLKGIYEKNGEVPKKYEEALKIGLHENWKPWRDIKGVEKNLRKAARKAIKAPGLEKLTYIAQVKALEDLARGHR